MNHIKNLGKIILASASPRRSLLLGEAGLDFEIDVSRADEISSSDMSPADLVIANASIKADDVASRRMERAVLGADTVVALDGKIFGKPSDLVRAKEMLSILSGKTHSVFTGIALVYVFDNGQKLKITAFEQSRVSFKNLDGAQIDEYLAKVDVLDKAGAYAAQECGSMIIEKIDGNFDNVMGLPCELVKKELDSFAAKLQS